MQTFAKFFNKIFKNNFGFNFEIGAKKRPIKYPIPTILSFKSWVFGTENII